MDFPKIMSEQFPHNMGPWLSEKSESGLKALVEIRKSLIHHKAKIDEKLLDELESDLYYAICQMTTIYNFSNGADWSVADVKLIFDNPDDGFEQLKVKNGLLEKTTKQIKEEKFASFMENIFEYLKMSQDPGRTYLQGLLDNNIQYIDNETMLGLILRKIEKELYKVANGELSWLDFVSFAQEEMEFYRRQQRETKWEEI